jgi:uridine kinase
MAHPETPGPAPEPPAETLPQVAATAARVARLALAAPPRAGATRVVGVDGPSGAGKTTLATAVAGALGGAGGTGRPAPVVHLDDIYPGWDGLADAVPRLLEWVLEPLAAGLPARYRRFDWPADEYAEWHDVATDGARALVVEGVTCGARACAPYLSLLLWVEAPRDLRFRRGIERDGEAYRPYWERWARQEDAHFAAEDTRRRADVVVDGSG